MTQTLKTSKTPRRSVSPFGFYEPAEDPFLSFKQALHPFSNLSHLPAAIEKLYSATANDAPRLEKVCNELIDLRPELEKNGLVEILFDAMSQVFDKKTESFYLDLHTPEQCEKMGEHTSHAEVVLFAKERDTLVGRFVEPYTDQNPGRFSEFINTWVETDNRDRLLHFLDFCRGKKDPTFEHYLLFAHPSLSRVVGNKMLMKNLLHKTEPLLKKFEGSAFLVDLKKSLAV